MELLRGDLIIQAAKLADLDQLIAWWSDGKVMAHAGFPHGLKTDKQELADKIGQHVDDYQLLVIVYKGQLIGEMSYRLLPSNLASIGIKICDFSQQDKGLGSQALSLLIDYLFTTIKVNKVILDTMVENKRAQHVYEKLGFKKVRDKPNYFKDQLGRLRSAIDYELEPSTFYQAIS